MDRLNQLRGDAGGSRDSTLDTSSLPGEAYLSANEGSSKYFSLSEVDSSFSISSSKETVYNSTEDVTNSTEDLTASDAERIISNLSPIPKKNELDSFKIGEQIEAANILSGGVNIFEDNENSYDEDELVIDDAVQEGDNKSSELKLNENSEPPFEKGERVGDSNIDDSEAVSPTKDTEVVLQIDGKNVDAIDIGNGLYLYRKDGEEELAAVQILDDDQQQPNIKFLKVRENAEGNLEVYEEIEIEVPKEMPTQEGKSVKNSSHIPVKDLNKISEPISNKIAEKKSQVLPKDTSLCHVESDLNKDILQIESKTEVNLNGKMMKFSESRKSPLIGTFTPMTYHSTPNKEGIPLTKTMVDLQLHPNRHSENVKKTIEVHTDNSKQRLFETPIKNNKDTGENTKCSETSSPKDKEQSNDDIPVERPDQGYQESSEHIENIQIGNKLRDKVVMNIIDEKINVNSVKTDQNKLFNTKKLEENVVIDNKTEKSEIDTPSQLVKTALTPECMLNIIKKKGDDCKGKEKIPASSNLTKEKACIDETCPKIIGMNLLTKTERDEKGPLKIEEKLIKPEDIKVKVDEKSKEMKVKEDEKYNNVILKEYNIKENSENIVIIENQKLDDINVMSDIESHTDKIQNSSETLEMMSVEIISTDLNKQDRALKNSQKEVELKLNTDYIPPKENKQAEELESIPDLKQINTKTDVTMEIKKSVEGNDIQIKESKILPDILIKTNSTSELPKKLVKIVDNSQKETKVDREIKPPLDNSIILGNLPKASEKNIENLLKKPEESINTLQISPQKPELNAIAMFKQPETKSKVNIQKDMEIKTNSEIKQKKEKKDSDSSDQLPHYVRDTELNKSGHVSEKNLSNFSKDVAKSGDVELKQLENSNLSISDGEALKLAPNNDLKKNSIESLPIKEANTAGVEETQKLFESKNKSSIVCEKLKQSVNQSESTQNLQKEVDRSKNDSKKEPAKFCKNTITKPINNNKAAVPFGKWTEANRQEFLNKIKEAKIPTHTSNTKQLKQPNDLNRRDILQKIDSQRQSNNSSAKVQELSTINKNKNEAGAFVSKSNTTQKEKSKDSKDCHLNSKAEEIVSKPQVGNKIGQVKKVDKEKHVPLIPVDMSSIALNVKKDPVHRKEINNQDLIDKTIEGIINRAVTAKFSQDDVKQSTESLEKQKNATSFVPVSLDEIESKMNELHGIPFVERPPHELPKVFDHESKSIVIPDVSIASTTNKVPNLIPFTNKPQQIIEQNALHPVTRAIEDSDEEIIEHEPITGDSELSKKKVFAYVPAEDKIQQDLLTTKVNRDFQKEAIITEKDFDKFARRNSITYENCLTVNFDGKEQHNVIHTVIEKEVPKKLSRNEIMLAQSKAKSNKHIAMRHNNLSSKIPTFVKTTNDEDSYNKNYQSKVQIAYQSVMTAKRQQECPITIIEDKPVKVVFMDANPEFTPHQLNVQGKDLSPSKKSMIDWDHFTHSNSESMDSDILEAGNDSKSQDDTKFKSKHQRKQVLTPVDAPELELIEPCDLGIEVSPKKKRKIEDSKSEKNCKNLVPKKSYLLNRSVTTDDTLSNPQDLTKPMSKESVNQPDIFVKHSDAKSAIDNLVKAAELLETQSENKHVLSPSDQISVNQQNTPAKRGRGRPRKYPLPESESDSKSPSPVKTPTPQKKPRLIDAKIPKPETDSEDDDMSSDSEFVKENWTMGKINENIVCPICNKLFRSENVVFKHVKHCTGPSPSRSDSDKRSPRRMRQSQELDWRSDGSKSDSIDIDDSYEENKPTKKRKSKENKAVVDDKADIIIIDDTPVKETLEKREKLKHEPNKSIGKTKVHSASNLVCEFCGKTFRQLSYLVNHKLQHKNTESKKLEKEQVHKSLFSCEVCKKDFRKLHHLVQHRIIHNPNPISSRSSRRSSSEQGDNKTVKGSSKSSEDQSAGFRCEPCDKSFRKLHHLVEHRETHDEMNKKCNSTTLSVVDTTKANPFHNCDVCKKTFKKLQHLIEHKEHHLETSSEKSDDKSVKSSLSTKDIIHECPLCYMVFPNEHSLNKHTFICQRKKKQSAAKQIKQIEENDAADGDDDAKVTEEGEEKVTIEDVTDSDTCVIVEDVIPSVAEKESTIKDIERPVELEKQKEVDINVIEIKPVEEASSLVTTDIPIKEKSVKPKDSDESKSDKFSLKSRKHVIPTSSPTEIIKILDTPTPKKKLSHKNKIATISKRKKTISVPLSPKNNVKTEDSSDDEEIRYMINPNLMDESTEGKLFMRVRAMKRNSLQIERPNSKDLMKRSMSLQHPLKIPRLKVKPILKKPINTNTVIKSTKATKVQSDPGRTTDSDDNDVKYSFPVNVKKETKDVENKVKRQSIVGKRKSLSGIAKKKSLGKVIAKHKIIPSPAKQIKKRSTHAELRCDCGQLFSSAALLARHASLAHTPPRVRRRRSPPPDKPVPDVKSTKPTKPTKSTRADLTGPRTGVATRKSSVSGDVKAAESKRLSKVESTAASAKVGVETRKSNGSGDAKAAESRRSTKTDPTPARSKVGVVTRKSSSNGDAKTVSEVRRTRRSGPHQGVPVPEKMRKLMEKSRK